ncbi:MAG: TetR/AcrR family transcriptional regulator [Candidatus Pelagadaptatus aseana]|uniref:acrylate utilization transcriptional regulator AcuR n=1 Tax=Candidatus Pelagadaptatus aseana TaxID=3120508 RepID=UPI0039B32627
MTTSAPTTKRRRGRPPAGSSSPAETRQAIIQTGVVILTEQGFAATGIDKVLKQARVPKGSFYHYFASKEAFILEVVDAYGVYFARKLDRHFSNTDLSPLMRLAAFVDDAIAGMKRHAYERGCLIGNLGQEVSIISPALRERVEHVLQDWEARLADCLEQAVVAGELAAGCDCRAEASYFWTGWEGAVMRARLQRDTALMALFGQRFIQHLPTGSN